MIHDQRALFNFKALNTKLSETPDENGNRKICYICEEQNNEIHLFLWIDKNNRTVAFQFFFFEKVLDWNQESGLTTNITNRLESPCTEDKIGFLKGSRTLTRVNDPGILNEAIEIISKSVFPTGIAEILESKIIQ